MNWLKKLPMSTNLTPIDARSIDPDIDENNYKCLCFAIVIVFWLKWAGYLAVIGLI